MVIGLIEFILCVAKLTELIAWKMTYFQICGHILLNETVYILALSTYLVRFSFSFDVLDMFVYISD